jgi:hypothetical protein
MLQPTCGVSLVSFSQRVVSWLEHTAIDPAVSNTFRGHRLNTQYIALVRDRQTVTLSRNHHLLSLCHDHGVNPPFTSVTFIIDKVEGD